MLFLSKQTKSLINPSSSLLLQVSQSKKNKIKNGRSSKVCEAAENLHNETKYNSLRSYGQVLFLVAKPKSKIFCWHTYCYHSFVACVFLYFYLSWPYLISSPNFSTMHLIELSYWKLILKVLCTEWKKEGHLIALLRRKRFFLLLAWLVCATLTQCS